MSASVAETLAEIERPTASAQGAPGTNRRGGRDWIELISHLCFVLALPLHTLPTDSKYFLEPILKTADATGHREIQLSLNRCAGLFHRAEWKNL